MNKIIWLVAISILLTSCWGNSETKENTTNNNLEVTEINIDNNIEENTWNENNTWSETIVDNNEKDPVTNNENKGWDITNNENTAIDTNKSATWKTNNEETSDEEVLESEVNDLLDEFIDSLDSYDK